MLNKISKEGEYKFNKSRTDSEEFNFRIVNLHNCIRYYAAYNSDTDKLSVDLKRADINYTCSRQLNELKSFINSTGGKYENVYAPLSGSVMASIKKSI